MDVPLQAAWPNKEQLGLVGNAGVSDAGKQTLEYMMEQRCLRNATCFAYFAVFNKIFILPVLFIWMLYVIKNPLLSNGHLCHCCEGHGLYSCMEIPSECCCECKGIGNTLFGTPFNISFLMYCISIGLFELALFTKSMIIFIFNCLQCKTLKYSFIRALSLNDFRFTKDMRIISIIHRLISFIWIFGILITRFDFECSCFYPGAMHPIEYGLQYVRYKQLIQIMVLHLLFCGISLVSRIILLKMIKNIKIKPDLIVFKLHYIKIDSIYKKQE